MHSSNAPAGSRWIRRSSLAPRRADAISPLDWLWEPEITAEIDRQIQAPVKGDSEGRRGARGVQAVADDLRGTGRSYSS